MSRILRRPMFRGGRVSAYGTGIAAPLVPGYQGGGQIGGGIIYGKPMADGRYGFQNVELFDVKDAIGEIETGQKITDKNVPASNWENLVELEKFEAVPKYTEEHLQGQFNHFVKGVGKRIVQGEDDALQTDVDMGMQLQPPVSAEDAAFWKIYKEDPEQAYKYWKDNISTWGTKQEEQMKHAKTIGAEVDYGVEQKDDIPEKTADQLEIDRLNKIIVGEEKPEVDARTAVAENKALFADLLGIDKARGQDISDMLLGFAGAEGDDTWSKFQSFARDEAKRPGRRRKISDAAGTLAIQDYIAGNRSKQKIDYAQQVKLNALVIDEDDSLSTVATKLNAVDKDINNMKGLKEVIAAKDKEDGRLVYSTSLKLKDIRKGNNKKILKNLKEGYNIIDNEGVKWIIKYDGSGSINGVSKPVTITQFWKQTS